MGAETWSLTVKLFDSCKAAPAAVFCRVDSAFLCGACDGKIYAANKLALLYGLVWIYEVCKKTPASFTCKANAASICAAYDRDIHSANPLVHRHDCIPVVPFYDSAVTSSPSAECSEKEAEAASWLLQHLQINLRSHQI